LTVAVVNPGDKPHSLELAVRGVQLTGEGMSWVITGPDRFAHNDPGKPRVVDIRQEPHRSGGDLRIAPLSVSVFELRVR